MFDVRRYFYFRFNIEKLYANTGFFEKILNPAGVVR